MGQLLSVLLFTAEGLAQQEHMLLKDGAGVGLLIASSRVAGAARLIALDKINSAFLACLLFDSPLKKKSRKKCNHPSLSGRLVDETPVGFSRICNEIGPCVISEIYYAIYQGVFW